MGFKKGESGNPKGRKAGKISELSKITKQMVDDYTPRGIAKVIELADQGNVDCLKMLVGKKINRKLVNINIPKQVNTMDDLKQINNEIFTALEAKEIATDEGLEVMEMVKMHKEVILHADLDERMTKLEKQIDTKEKDFKL